MPITHGKQGGRLISFRLLVLLLFFTFLFGVSLPADDLAAAQNQFNAVSVTYARLSPEWQVSALQLAKMLTASKGVSYSRLNEAQVYCRAIINLDSTSMMAIRAKLILAQIQMLHYREFEKASTLFKKIIAETTDRSPLHHQALFGLATCLQHKTPTTIAAIEHASDSYQRILELIPEAPLAARSALNLGRLDEMRDYAGDAPDYPAARQWYRKVMTGWGDQPIAGEAAFRLATTFIQEGYNGGYERSMSWPKRQQKVEEGIQVIETWLEDHPDELLGPGMWEYAGQGYRYMWDDKASRRKALECYLRATGDWPWGLWHDPVPIKQNMNRTNPGYLFWHIGVLAEKQNRRPIALEYYCRMITEADAYGLRVEAWLKLRGMDISEEKILARMKEQWQWQGKSDTEIATLMKQTDFSAVRVGGAQ